MSFDPERHSYLAQRLSDVTLQPIEYREYCYLEALRNGSIDSGLVLAPLNEFVTDAMLLQYWSAIDWWPKDLPAHPCPTLQEFALHACHLPERKPLNLGELLAARGQRCAAALLEAKRSVVNPNESKAERAKRLNRERVSRSRGRKSSDSVPVAPEGANAAVRAPVEPVADRVAVAKASMRAELLQIDRWVKEAHTEMTKRADVRKDRKRYWTGVIEGLKQTGG